jgi:hypothetical protein
MRAVVCAAVCVLAAALMGCGSHARSTTALARINQSLARAEAYLCVRQSDDGAWRSGVYGFFRDGQALTPHVAWGLCRLSAGDERARQSVERAANRLEALAAKGPDELEELGIIYPVYAAAEASEVLGGTRDTARRVWLTYLRSHQLVEALGWQPTDADYGGWGYAPVRRRKPGAGGFQGPWDWSNLTATAWAARALRSAGVPAEDAACRSALRLAVRCQNDGGGPEEEGGFFFSPTAAIRNKAGEFVDAQGVRRFHSYGSMTCDGITAMLACGAPADDARIVAARRWLERNFSVRHNPGRFIQANEDLRDATFYYYTWSLSEALTELKVRRLRTAAGEVDWADALAEELMSRQREDGAWVNRFSDGKEDEPLVATPLAVAALENCRKCLGRR